MACSIINSIQSTMSLPKMNAVPGFLVVHSLFPEGIAVTDVLPLILAVFLWSDRDVLGNVEVMQLDFEMENFTSLSVTRRINWNIDYKGQNPPPDSEKVVTELTVVQRDIQAIIPLAMVSEGIDRFLWGLNQKIHTHLKNVQQAR